MATGPLRVLFAGCLKPGEIFGGITILMNAGISVRTAKIADKATLYTLPQNVFLEVCARNNFLYEHFAVKYRERMSDETYSSVAVAGQVQHLLSRLV